MTWTWMDKEKGGNQKHYIQQPLYTIKTLSLPCPCFIFLAYCFSIWFCWFVNSILILFFVAVWTERISEHIILLLEWFIFCLCVAEWCCKSGNLLMYELCHLCIIEYSRIQKTMFIELLSSVKKNQNNYTFACLYANFMWRFLKVRN